jgi:FixJ family two-component response regulator
VQDEEKQKRIQLFERRVFDNSIYFLASNDVWDKPSKLKELANDHFNNIFYRLEEIDDLTEHDKIICLMILLDFSNKEMAFIMHVQPNTISKSKKKIAKNIGVASADIRVFLIQFLA